MKNDSLSFLSGVRHPCDKSDLSVNGGRIFGVIFSFGYSIKYGMRMVGIVNMRSSK